jgi:amidase
MDWQAACTNAQSSVLASIPRKWILLSVDKTTTDVTSIPRTCGLLTSEQLTITELTATALLKKLHTGELTSVEVTEAFCGRAAIAHQVVSR